MLSRFLTILAATTLLSFTKSEPFEPSPPPPMHQDHVIIGYYQFSHSQYQRLENVAWGRYTHMVFHGAWPIDQFEFTFGSDDQNQQAIQYMQPFVQYADQNNVRPLLGMGGEQGSKLFSYYLSDGSRRSTFVRNLVSLAQTYNFQGVVVTWLAPNTPGVGCNTRSPNDAVNFGLFAQEFKKVWKQGRLIIRANFNGFIGATGNYATSEETSLIAQNIDYIDLMAFDGYTGNRGARTGPFSALTADCPKIPYLSNGIKELLQIMQFQGFSVNKLILGFTGYGRVFYLPKHFNMKTDISQVAYGAAPPGGWTDNLNGTLDACGQYRGFEGIYLLNELLEYGWLESDGVTATQLVTRGWDDCAKQAYLYTNDYLLVYDDPGSLKIKSQYARTSGLAGISFYYSMGFPNGFIQAAMAPWPQVSDIKVY
ncbi:hypothetical protein PGT21_007950 [Puccinia graminis f. sp. tritici]|uniref:GH18 domain-containing protein n=1 Tax=Puccinia graminis f. sp. tritici TaxID=56615 RepID=A0A5B0RHN6_PUCGR|nr:hypothetical protein PGT21_007950 [Puccinia graminis f. sp. tritici]KAA1124304.1 hypothetical protein PGTUg99_024266 [Puccinia graminis f. sp. tritici]